MRQLVITQSITSRESLSVEKYLQEVSKFALVTAEEEAQLTRSIKQGDLKAMDKMVKANLRFVVSVAKKYQGQGLPLSDLINEGNIGLIEAARRFDETKGFKFISYAVWWIRQNIMIAISEKSRLIRLPMHQLAKSRQIQKAHITLEQQFEREPTTDELSELLEIETGEIENISLALKRHDSLDSPLTGDDESTMLDKIENPNAAYADHKLDHQESLNKELDRILGILNEKQRKVVCYFFGIGLQHPLSLEAIGAQLDVTTERVRQIKEKALCLLRAEKNNVLLKAFV